ncbi:MAG: VCBS repeat-containing protein [Verrucomicrobia bacterium]|nr:VCBS repeat-containing protein [Verrucomicrobiota bacterium]
MQDLRDIALDVGFQSIQATGGIWTGTSAVTPYYVYPLSPGFLRPNYTSYYSRYTGGMPYGPLNPLNADRYSHLSFRMSLAQTERSYISIFWAKQFNQWPAAEGNLITWFDGEPSFNGSGQYVTLPQSSGFRIYDIDPNGTTWMNERNSFLAIPPNKAGLPWSGMIYGFHLWPSSQGSAGATVSFDWIRAYDPAASPTVSIQWSSSGLDGAYDSIQLFIDNNASGFDGDLLVSGLDNDGRYDLKTAALPPGDYYVYLKGIRHQNSALQQIALSAYSALIRIGHPPVIDIQSPSFTSGVDYATSELNNPWDFTNGSDIDQLYQMNSVSYAGGIFSAITDSPIPPYPESDDQIWLNTKRNGVIVPINTRKYRYFTHTIKCSPVGYGDIFDKVARGWESRVLWWNEGITLDGTYSKDIPLLEEWRTYTVDLWDNLFHEDRSAVPEIPQRGWEEVGFIKHLRFDPMEAHIPTQFWLDEIKLCAENTPTQGLFQVAWNLTDLDGDLLSIQLFADRQNEVGTIVPSTTPIATLQQYPGPGSWTWPPGARVGRYYIRMVVSDGSRSVESLSVAPILLGPTQPTIPVSGDYDGDGISDLAAYEMSTGLWYIRPSSTNSFTQYNLQWGDSSMIPVPGDYNGDGVYDLALYQPTTGNWFIRTITNGPPITFGQNWGDASMDPAPGDYNGDGIFDLAVYQRTTGNWFIRSLGPIGPAYPPITFGQNWGDASMIPVPGDYNRDGKHDLAVYQKATGNWFIRSLGPIGPAYPPITFGQNWGDASMDPVPGDFNGDLRADLAVYQRATGNWFIRSLGPVGPAYPPITFGQNWGDASMDPIPGDYNGDGKNDLAVYQRTSGAWFVRKLGPGAPLYFGTYWGSPQ